MCGLRGFYLGVEAAEVLDGPREVPDGAVAARGALEEAGCGFQEGAVFGMEAQGLVWGGWGRGRHK
jgi:hypothetical protein